jgi:hypothetical protein
MELWRGLADCALKKETPVKDAVHCRQRDGLANVDLID